MAYWPTGKQASVPPSTQWLKHQRQHQTDILPERSRDQTTQTNVTSSSYLAHGPTNAVFKRQSSRATRSQGVHTSWRGGQRGRQCPRPSGQWLWLPNDRPQGCQNQFQSTNKNWPVLRGCGLCQDASFWRQQEEMKVRLGCRMSMIDSSCLIKLGCVFFFS